MIRLLVAACLTLVALPGLAGNWPELKLASEHPIEGMRGGNLSGLAECRGGLWGVPIGMTTVFTASTSRAPSGARSR